MNATESQPWREEASGEGTYRIHRDGRVAVYTPELTGPRPDLWLATAWTADPRTNPNASHQNLCADASRDELAAALRAWEDASQ